jgi:hypothetical protein
MYHLVELECVELLFDAADELLMWRPTQVTYASTMATMGELNSISFYQQFIGA